MTGRLRPEPLRLTLEAGPGATLVQRVVQTVIKAILEGRLRPGTVLPGSRALATLLGVNRHTVIPALNELVDQGWLVTEPSRGTFVALELPSQARTVASARETGVGFDLPSFLLPASVPDPTTLFLADGTPDPRLAPAQELSRAYQRALRHHAPALLRGQDPLGHPILREAVAGWVGERHGLAVSPDRVLITRGSRAALAMLVATLFRKQAVVGVESPGNRAAWDIFLAAGHLTLRPLPVDAEGLDTEALAALLAQGPVRLLYLTPRRQFPTAVSLSRPRAEALLALAASHRVAILEDDYDGEFAYGDPRPESLLALDRTGQVIHLGSLSRLLTPGLRLGYLVVPAALVPLLARIKRPQDLGDAPTERAVADLIRDGELGAHLRRTRRIYEGRRDLLCGRLQEELGGQLEVAVPTGGLGLWLRAAPGVDLAAWLRRARDLGLRLHPPDQFFLGEPAPAFRMGFSQATEEELASAVTRLKAALGRSR
ncbi:aminotransferase-like domain-containing protein [Mesoterricola sediminis]|uniref:GntR family transcriptional regulator n=1 Tax=Mesoterricola sediminis TaxID=2927980 RepID=A0AA48GUD5_9BACT|nr:PLP-dependent aminotransferase family protein [Mesoterricola sediminis]BDU75820.1 GntR family transcriptional regulator [Mesoterricola sediminis]